MSEETVRRDINELADEAKLIRIWGGGLSKAYHHNGAHRETYGHQNKRMIAEKCLPLLHDDSVTD